MNIPHRVKNLSGMKFGRLAVTGFSHIGSGRRAFWNCDCDCGKQCVTAGIAMTTGHTLSCGCLGAEVKERGTKLRHGKTKSKVWNSWLAMIQRCTYPRNDRFVNYGGRGITVCDRWMQFDLFYEDMGDPPEGHTLERKNVDEGYSKNNCEWIPAKDQYYNKTNTLRVCIYGYEVPFAWLVHKSGVKMQTAYARMFRYGWSPEKTFPNLKPESLHDGPGVPAPAVRPDIQPHP